LQVKKTIVIFELFPVLCIDFKIRTIEVDGKKIKLQICISKFCLLVNNESTKKVVGKECMKLSKRNTTVSFYKFNEFKGIMLVYDITNEKSFDNIKNWIRNIEEHASSDVDRMIIGNKCDIEERRQVSRERGEQLAIEYGTKFLETSAKANINVEEAFFTLARDIKLKTERATHQSTTQNSGRISMEQPQKKSASIFSGWRCSLL
uniref:Ras-related protein Rab-8A n=1 Tax=Anisakis simplex TaxID=6269 RepID=A0A158PP07_ANISI